MKDATEQFVYDWDLVTGVITGRRKLNKRDRKRFEREVAEWYAEHEGDDHL